MDFRILNTNFNSNLETNYIVRLVELWVNVFLTMESIFDYMGHVDFLLTSKICLKIEVLLFEIGFYDFTRPC